MAGERHQDLSRFLSFVLRHRPDAIGLTLAPGGWVEVDALLTALARSGRPTTREVLAETVAESAKRRFTFSDDGERIRASQGHSMDIGAAWERRDPPPKLFHGTASRFLDRILATGLEPRGRHHVHLSADTHGAREVGARHGRPVVLVIDAAGLAATGEPFFLSENGVWLTAHVPPTFLTVLDPES